MSEIEYLLEKVQKKKENLNFINDILIELSQNSKKSHLHIVDYLLETFEKTKLRKININLVYLLGELGKDVNLEKKYIEYLFATFYSSDRWIRAEVLKAFEKNIGAIESNDMFFQALSSALKEEYETNNINALIILLQLDEFPKSLFEDLLMVLNVGKPNLKKHINKMIKRFFFDESSIFTLLNLNGNYRIVKPRGFRSILQSILPSVNKIQALQRLIEDSNWEETSKSLFLKEIALVINLINKLNN